jgi:hypothetical protein
VEVSDELPDPMYWRWKITPDECDCLVVLGMENVILFPRDDPFASRVADFFVRRYPECKVHWGYQEGNDKMSAIKIVPPEKINV